VKTLLKRLALAVFFLTMSGNIAGANTSLEEARAQNLFRSVKCPVCEGQAVGDSDSDTAKEFQAIIREKIRAGKSDEEIYAFFRERYGDEILLFPPHDGYGFLLNAAPLVILAGGFFLFFIKKRKKT
jgi:cytochrome c-type biogenesis protein CcmH